MIRWVLELLCGPEVLCSCAWLLCAGRETTQDVYGSPVWTLGKKLARGRVPPGPNPQ